jgi:bacteriorhodopsin
MRQIAALALLALAGATNAVSDHMDFGMPPTPAGASSHFGINKHSATEDTTKEASNKVLQNQANDDEVMNRPGAVSHDMSIGKNIRKPNSPLCLSEMGHKVIWGGFACLALPTIYFFLMTFKQPEGKRTGHIITLFITMIASLAYLTMATGHGFYTREFDNRDFYYARYIDWAFTTPLMLIHIIDYGGGSDDTRNWLCSVDVLMIFAGLIGGFLDGQEKYYFWIFGMLMFVPILHAIFGGLKESAANKSVACQKVFSQITKITAMTWCCYPVVWVLAEGNGTLSVDHEAICYTVLDVIAKSFFGFAIISANTEGPSNAPQGADPL